MLSLALEAAKILVAGSLTVEWLIVCLSPALIFWALFIPLAYPHVIASVDASPHRREAEETGSEWRFDVERFD